jgi:hypothetical protein
VISFSGVRHDYAYNLMAIYSKKDVVIGGGDGKTLVNLVLEL